MTDVTLIPEGEVDALLAPFGGAEAVYAADAALRENRKYLDEHREELKRLYPEEWIVIASGRVVAHADTPDEAVRMARERGEPMAGAFVRHLPTEERAWLLQLRRIPC